MTPGARVAAAITVLDEIVAGAPAEQALTRWARASRFAGSGDRAAVRTHVFDVLRRWRSTAARGGGEDGRARMLGLLADQGADLDEMFSGQGHAPAPLTPEETAASGRIVSQEDLRDVPDWIWPLFESSLGLNAAPSVAALRHRAPIFLRVNLSRTNLDSVISSLAADGVEAVPCPEHPAALEVVSGERKLRGSVAFAEGGFELQDLSSQRAAALVPLPDGDLLDLCAGGGGKALALADRAASEGRSTRIFVHDADPARMSDLPNRAARAGVTLNTLTSEALRDRRFASVLLDVPCSGSGTWRRQPEAKWSLTPDDLEKLQQVQGELLQQGHRLCEPGGHLTYMTCSVFDVENVAQIERLMETIPGHSLAGQLNQMITDRGDGFFTNVIKCL